MLNKLLDGVQIAAVVCNQWGDTGKGKIVDLLAGWADVIARGTGGNNAGHTVIIDGKERVYHLIPSGIRYDSQGKINLLGNGMVIDPIALCNEFDMLENDGASYDNLMISQDAHVIMPYHIVRDRAKNQSLKSGGIGSTGRGIGPCYADKTSRRGIKVGDLYNESVLKRKIEKIAEFYSEQEIDPNSIIKVLKPYAARMKPFVKDTIKEMHRYVKEGKKILLEGAQGLLLSIEYGTYPYVTSSDPSLSGTAAGVGLSAKMVDLPLGIIKFPLMTRVGGGPFPTELGNTKSEEYCAAGLEHDIFYESKHWLGMDLDLEEVRDLQNKNDKESMEKLLELGEKVKDHINNSKEKIINLMNSSDELEKSVGMRLASDEYGATTKRPRRIGWTDAIAARYAAGINGPLFILTKVDTLAGAKEFSVCYGYKNSKTLDDIEHFTPDSELLRNFEPKLKNYEGYGDLGDIREYEKLPKMLKESISDFENFTGGKVVMVSVGPEQDQVIVR